MDLAIVSLVAGCAWVGALAIIAAVWGVATRAKALPLQPSLRLATSLGLLAWCGLAIVVLVMFTVEGMQPDLGFWGFLTRPYLRLALHGGLIGIGGATVLCWGLGRVAVGKRR